MPIPLPDLPGVYYARELGTFEGRPSTNVLTFQIDSPPATGPTDVAAAAAVSAIVAHNWVAFAAAVFPTQYTAAGCETYALHTPLAPKETALEAAHGGFLSDLTAISASMLIHHTTTRRGRGSQSRTNLSPVMQNILTTDASSINDIFRASTQLAWDTFIAAVLLALAAEVPGVWSYVQLSKGYLPTPVGATFPISGSTVEAKLSTQRKRAQRRG